jgi:hypothetical protein
MRPAALATAATHEICAHACAACDRCRPPTTAGRRHVIRGRCPQGARCRDAERPVSARVKPLRPSFARTGPRVRGLAAGGKWIRTVSPIPMRARTLSWR